MAITRSEYQTFLTMASVLLAMMMLSGCAVFLAAKQPDYVDLNALSAGAPRSKVIAELGAPILTEERDGKKIDVFSFKQGYGKGNKTARAFFHAAADVWTLGLWEVIGTPAEIIASGKKMRLEVTYNAKDQVEQLKSLDDNVPTEQKEKKGTEITEEKSAKSPQPDKDKIEHIAKPAETIPAMPHQEMSTTPRAADVPATTPAILPGPASYSEYYRFLNRSIDKSLVAPAGCEGGVVNMSLTLSSSGTIQDITILDGSSENSVLREAALSAIKNSAPFPSFSKDMEEDKKTFMLSLDFKFSK